MHSRTLLANHPIRFLILCFLAWKTLLLLVASASPGPGYDTSASLLGPAPGSVEKPARELPAPLGYLAEKLTRWDAIYYVKVANRGYLFEQEWAFGWGFTRTIAFCTAGIGKLGVPRYEGLEALVGVVIAHGAHLLSVLVLFALGITVFPSSNSGFALTAALLHIISPAGLFLSAPFAESPCALMTFSGVLLFAKGLAARGQPTAWQDLLVLLSGVSFGIATTLRSNGIFNGLLLLEEAFRTLFSLRYGFRVSTVRHLIATGLGGMSVGAGFLLPQFIAWREYCYQPNADANLSRPWCQKPLPSIYSFVQEHYWNVGLFRYWTISNIPLFLLAAPMISLMVMSGLWALKHETRETNRSVKLEKEGKDLKDASEQFPIIRNLAVSQLILTLLTLTTAHVQIVTRVSSSYPVSLWYLAALARKGGSPRAVNFIRFMVIYAIVQGGLFASFLPPA